MKAVVYYAPKDLRFEEVETPKIKQNEVMINVAATGICGSDLAKYHGERIVPPMIMGHELSGIVLNTGKEIKNFKTGDRVTVDPIIFCGKCEFCKNGFTNICLNKRHLGVLDTTGSMAEYIVVPEKLVYGIPDEISYEVAAMIEPLTVAINAVNKSPEIEDKNILIVGAGTIGLLILQVIKIGKPKNIFISDINPTRLNFAKKAGADITIDVNSKDLIETINKNTDNKGIDISFEAVGLSSTVQQAMSVLKRKGTCVWIGNLEKMINIDMQQIVLNELNVHGSYGHVYGDFDKAIKILANKDIRINLENMITRRVALSDAAKIFKEMDKSIGDIIKIILVNENIDR
jgi:2-desacetyl-2-hydroxyethyl bacteriochlorophyllide A dehydrogenase